MLTFAKHAAKLREIAKSLSDKRRQALCESRASYIENGGAEFKDIRIWLDDAERWLAEQNARPPLI